jgi:type I restriction enzyme, S subunit
MINGLKPYPKMKDSGVAWLGKVPEHWEVRRGKALFRCIDVRSMTGDEELLTVSSGRGVVPRRTANVTMFKAESYEGYKLCWPGDLVINSLWAWAGGLGVSRQHGIVSSAYGVYRLQPGGTFNPMFFHQLVRSTPFQWELQVRSKGIWTSRLQLTDESFLGAPFVVPPIQEQSAIVRYLDYMDRRIGRYIRAKQKLIKLLEEQKQAIIRRTVTRGLDPNARLKPSGIEWLGDIPKQWRTSRLKHEASHIVDCLHATPRYADDGEYPAVRTADIVPGGVRLSTVRRVDRQQYDLWTSRLVPSPGDILYSREGERFGLAALVPAGIELCISQRMMIFRIRPPQRSDFIMWQLNCVHVYAQAAADIIGAAAPHVNVERIRNYRIAVPPVDEQAAIASWIRKETAQFEEAGDKIRLQLSQIREYLTRLIADVVTGKLDVREAATHLPDESEELDVAEETETVIDDEALDNVDGDQDDAT